MTDKKRPPESDGKDGESAPASGLATASPLSKFKTLARRLAQVSREELAEEQRKYEQSRKRKKDK